LLLPQPSLLTPFARALFSLSLSFAHPLLLLRVCVHHRLIARDRRLARAQDLSFKHELLPADIQAVQTPGKPYLAPIMAELKKIREEREEMKIN
jgi:hypothetical protein